MGTLGGIPHDVGDVLAKKYRLERLVGEGGTGVVVAARHVQLDRPVAIKFLRTALASDEIRLRFEREARAIGQIESEHVVLVLDVGTLDDGHSPYMVMEYLEGKDLARTLKEDGKLSIEDSVDCMLQVCEALAGAHARGIIHRDLKPANLFLTRRDDGGPHIKVVDFGISKILDPKVLRGDKGPNEMTNAFTVLGSPRYMAPEQLRKSKDVDGRADLWSIGAVLFQLLSGTSPFDAENNVHVSLAVLTKEPALLRSVAPHVPAELEAIVSRCLTKDRAGRFQSAAELADALYPFGSDRTRESLDRLQQAKEAPSLNLALDTKSEGRRVDTAPNSSRSAPSEPALAPMPSSPSSFGGASMAPPSSGDPAAAFAGGTRRPPSTTVKVAIALAGVLVVLLAFGAVTLMKMAARSMGVLRRTGSEAPAAAASPVPGAAERGKRVQGPSQAVTVTLDAGRPPP
jgi:serine/threonine-protein kinase